MGSKSTAKVVGRPYVDIAISSLEKINVPQAMKVSLPSCGASVDTLRPFNVGGLPPEAPKGRRVAEREGFEPSIRLPVCRISSAVLSTAQPPLRRLGKAHGLAAYLAAATQRDKLSGAPFCSAGPMRHR
jgi:hypothetical protein